MSLHLIIKQVQVPAGQSASEFPVDIDGSCTVEELKEQVAGRVGISKDSIRLVCAGRIWQDAFTIASYEPSPGSIVHCLNNPPRQTPSSTEQTLSAPNPMAAMMGGTPSQASLQAAANSGDPMQQMMAQSQQMLMNNPEMMQQIMSSPMVQQMMSNPETVRAMMRMNPQLNQLMEQRPEVARLLEDPEVLQQSMRMMANPSLMREMTRNADRAIGQLDAMPGGHNALVRAHEEIADPVFEAFTGGGSNQGTAEVNSYTQPTEGGPNNEALPNPWGPAAAPASAAPAPATGTAPGITPGAPAANPMAALFGAPPAGGTPTPGQQNDPFGAMMQQMMQNPQMMQQSMALAQQMGMGGGMGAFGAPAPGATAPAATPATPAAPAAPMANPYAALFAPPAPAAAPATVPGVDGAAPAAPMANPFAAMFMPPATPAAAPGADGAAPAPAANPFAAMMQQQMSNPLMMQNMLQRQMMFQQMMQGGGMGGFGAPATPVAASGTTPADGAATPAVGQDNPINRARFASQLAQLSGMGFSDEAACLRALAQHNGRVDAAIDTLLSEGSS